MGNMVRIKEKYVRLIGIPSVALIMQGVVDHDKGELSFFQNYLISLVFAAVYWNGCFGIFILYRKFFPSIRPSRGWVSPLPRSSYSF